MRGLQKFHKGLLTYDRKSRQFLPPALHSQCLLFVYSDEKVEKGHLN